MGSVVFSPDGTTMAAGDDSGSTYLWNLATRTVTATLTDRESNAGMDSVAFNANETAFAVGDIDGSTYLWMLAGHPWWDGQPGPTRPSTKSHSSLVTVREYCTGPHGGTGSRHSQQ